jgi:hypothetical protein
LHALHNLRLLAIRVLGKQLVKCLFSTDLAVTKYRSS